jgi:formylglycine-generating enzyme
MSAQLAFGRGLSGVVTAFVGASACVLLWTVPASAAGAGCPREMAHVGDACVDKFEASLVELHDDGPETPWSAYETPAGRRVRAVSREAVTPQAHISMVDAQRACKASGKRLCRAKEWKAACKGPDGTQFPYGSAREPNACVDTARTSPVNAKYAGEHTARTMNDPTLNQMPNTLEKTGAAEACTNAYGVHDMVGNIHEWTDDSAFRGGYYLDTKINGEGCDYVTTAHSAIYYDYSTGFRCCADEGALPEDEESAPPPAPDPPAVSSDPASAPDPTGSTTPTPLGIPLGAPLGDDPTPHVWLGSSAMNVDGSPRRRRLALERTPLALLDR